MKVYSIYYQVYNPSEVHNKKQKVNYSNPVNAKNFQNNNLTFTSTDDFWEKTKNLGKSIVNKTKDSFSDFSSLFKNSNDELSEEEKTFIESYCKKEEEIKAEYDKKIANIKDGFWDKFFNISENKRQKLRNEKEKALKIAYKYQDIFEKREKDSIANKEKFYELAKELNMSKEILLAFKNAEATSQRRMDIIKRRREILDKKGLSKIAGYTEEKMKLQESFLDLIDDEKAGKYLPKPIPNAILFYGPTGCGKSTFVNALAEETDCYLEVIQCFGTQENKEAQLHNILMGYSDYDINDNEIEIPGILDKAQENFLKTGKRTIVLIDEFDRFFGKKVSNKFISELKGILESCSEDYHVTFFFTSNKPQKIPYELRNSHRIEFSYPMDPPDKKNTVAVIEHYLDGCDKEDLDYDIILEKLFSFAPNEYYSNSHLKVICEMAADDIKPEESPLTTEMFLQAIDKYNESDIDNRLLRITKETLEQYADDKVNI